MFDECDATGQQRISAVLFRRAFRPGLAPCGWASDAYVLLATSCRQTGKAGLNSLLTPSLYGPVLLGQALCAKVCLPALQAHLSITHGLIWGNTAGPPQLEFLICFWENVKNLKPFSIYKTSVTL